MSPPCSCLKEKSACKVNFFAGYSSEIFDFRGIGNNALSVTLAEEFDFYNEINAINNDESKIVHFRRMERILEGLAR